MEQQVKIARVLYPVLTLGPGRRMAIWMAGCPRACKNCANPELQDDETYPAVSVKVIKNAIERILEKGQVIDGFTITGGEPLGQKEGLKEILHVAKQYAEDILVYTGYTMDELDNMEMEDVLPDIAVLIDGPYIEEQNCGHPLRGSENQDIHYFKTEFRENYECYIEQTQGKHLTQMFQLQKGKVAAGIHDRDFQEEYAKRIERKQNV